MLMDASKVREMLDLNIACDEKLPHGSGFQMDDDSGTPPRSSVVNAGEEVSNNGGDEDSSFTTSAFTAFDILKSPPRRAPNFATQQLLPPRNAGAGAVVWEFSSAAKPQWLNLSLANCGGPADSDFRVLHQTQPPPLHQQQQKARKSRRGPRSRSSQYRGVTFYRRTGRWESHIWDCGKQVYLGGFDTAQAAARAYDRAAIKFRGVDADINFNTSDYSEDMEQMKQLNKQEFVHILRRRSTGFTRGSSKYRAVTFHKSGQWEGQMGQILGKDAIDMAAIRAMGRNRAITNFEASAITNFDASSYKGEIALGSNNGGNVDNLDLNLAISPPSLKENGTARHYHLPCASNKMYTGPRPLVASSASGAAGGQIFAGSAMAPETIDFSGLFPNSLQKEEEIANEAPATAMSVEAASHPKFSNWEWTTWQKQSHGFMGTSPLPLFSSAASSGFSSALTPPPQLPFHYRVPRPKLPTALPL